MPEEVSLLVLAKTLRHVLIIVQVLARTDQLHVTGITTTILDQIRKSLMVPWLVDPTKTISMKTSVVTMSRTKWPVIIMLVFNQL